MISILRLTDDNSIIQLAVLQKLDEENMNQTKIEKMLDRDNLLHIAWLNRGLELSKAVARIVTPTRRATGFLIAPNLLMTNHHVIRDKAEANKSFADFNFQLAWPNKFEKYCRYQLKGDFFKTDEDLDYTIVGVSANPEKQYGYVDLNIRSEAAVNDYVSIIQHPEGGFKQIALTDSEVIKVNNHHIQYTTDTMLGSSGSPVFNQRWEIVALHRGVELIEVHGKRYPIKEGVQISRIIQHCGSRAYKPDNQGEAPDRQDIKEPESLYYLLIGDQALQDDLIDLATLIGKGGSNDEIDTQTELLLSKYPHFFQVIHEKEAVVPLVILATAIAAGAVSAYKRRRTQSMTTIEIVAVIPPSDELINLLKPYEKLLDESLEFPKKLKEATHILTEIMNELQSIGVDEKKEVELTAAGISIGLAAYDKAHPQ